MTFLHASCFGICSGSGREKEGQVRSLTQPFIAIATQPGNHTVTRSRRSDIPIDQTLQLLGSGNRVCCTIEGTPPTMPIGCHILGTNGGAYRNRGTHPGMAWRLSPRHMINGIASISPPRIDTKGIDSPPSGIFSPKSHVNQRKPLRTQPNHENTSPYRCPASGRIHGLWPE